MEVRERLGLAIGVAASLNTLAEIEISLRAATGDQSWRDWAEAMEGLKKPVSQIAMRAWGESLEAGSRGESPLLAIKEELRRGRAEFGPELDFAGLQKEAKSKFEKTAVNNADGGRGEAFLKDLATALEGIKQEMQASARGEGLTSRLAERREIAEAAKGGSKPSTPEGGGSSRL